MKRQYAVMALMFVMGALTGSVLIMQKPTVDEPAAERWEYAIFTIRWYLTDAQKEVLRLTPDFPVTAMHYTHVWHATDTSFIAEEIESSTGCSSTAEAVVGFLGCLGGQGWELVSAQTIYDDPSNQWGAHIEEYHLKRRIQ